MKAEAELKKAKAVSVKAKALYGKPRAVSRKAEATSRKAKAFSKDALEKELLKEARALKISKEESGKYVKKVAEKVTKWVEKRAGVTKADINRVVAKEVEKYNKDLAFIYKNRGKII